MGLSRHEYWRGLPCPPPGDLVIIDIVGFRSGLLFVCFLPVAPFFCSLFSLTLFFFLRSFVLLYVIPLYIFCCFISYMSLFLFLVVALGFIYLEHITVSFQVLICGLTYSKRNFKKCPSIPPSPTFPIVDKHLMYLCYKPCHTLLLLCFKQPIIFWGVTTC